MTWGCIARTVAALAFQPIASASHCYDGSGHGSINEVDGTGLSLVCTISNCTEGSVSWLSGGDSIVVAVRRPLAISTGCATLSAQTDTQSLVGSRANLSVAFGHGAGGEIPPGPGEFSALRGAVTISDSYTVVFLRLTFPPNEPVEAGGVLYSWASTKELIPGSCGTAAPRFEPEDGTAVVLTLFLFLL